MDFKLQMGRLLAILGVYLSIFFPMWPSVVKCITMGCFMFGVAWVLGFFSVFVLNCYVLGGEFEQLAAK